ncbi:MAG: hypothetical protein H6813_07010 [Phycisphaeraceae bacterium]|nr:hypothetical protein [Phycisphaeraceae bacterium]MCB9848685.1 hypothetical protein [Phycisphaeraceae bacterium]
MTPTTRTRSRALAVGLLLIAASSAASSAAAEQIATAAEMETFLSDSLIFEDYEGVNLHVGGSWPAANPLNDSTISSFFTIEAGVTYTSSVALTFYGTVVNGTDSVVLRGQNDLTLTFDELQAGVGFLLFGAAGDTQIAVYHGADVIGEPVFVGSGFIGWTDTAVGITSVTISSATGAIVAMDDMMFGATLNTGCPSDLNFDGNIDTADLGILIGNFGTNNTVGDINNDGVVDTADLGILIGDFDTACPN